jgi:hypothetical protein
MGANYNPFIIMQTVELSTAQLADLLGVSPRMVNIYRTNAEERFQRPIGAKRGRTIYFSPEEQDLIKSARAENNSHSTQAAASHHEERQERQAQNFHSQTVNAEAGVLDGMGAIVQAGDQNAIVMGQQLGQRWSALMFGTALQTMNDGIVNMSSQFQELQTAMNISMDITPQLPASQSASQLQLPEAEDDF